MADRAGFCVLTGAGGAGGGGTGAGGTPSGLNRGLSSSSDSEGLSRDPETDLGLEDLWGVGRGGALAESESPLLSPLAGAARSAGAEGSSGPPRTSRKSCHLLCLCPPREPCGPLGRSGNQLTALTAGTLAQGRCAGGRCRRPVAKGLRRQVWVAGGGPESAGMTALSSRTHVRWYEHRPGRHVLPVDSTSSSFWKF